MNRHAPNGSMGYDRSLKKAGRALFLKKLKKNDPVFISFAKNIDTGTQHRASVPTPRRKQWQDGLFSWGRT